MICLLFLFCAATVIASPAQTFTRLATFDETNGSYPLFMALVQGTDGKFYGTTSDGGIHGDGSIFAITAGGKLTTVYSFCAQANCTDGRWPQGGLVQTTNGDFYGTTYAGGANSNNSCPAGCGTVFKVTPTGTLTMLYNFCSQTDCIDGIVPFAGLVQDTNGDLYGTTAVGGDNNGTIFKITPGGEFTTLFLFQGNDGAEPGAALIQAIDGALYGTTAIGGAEVTGTVFEITAEGMLTNLHTFDGPDGLYPQAPLVQATNGDFYGTTGYGAYGSNHCQGGCGTIFKITPAGVFTNLHSFFGSPTEGGNPMAGLVQATDGNFYGTTSYGGASKNCKHYCGTLFQITPAGVLTTLHSFSGPDGEYPKNGLMQATDGDFYGAATDGGNGTCLHGCGTVFRLSMGLGPFVKTNPTSGKVGSGVIILGNKLTGATSVTFNGTAVGSFTVNKSGSAITTTVPIGATTGTVAVTTPSGTLTSNVGFRVRP
jgi:uncharacterized repeat protein (TIGR03803 family)